MQTDEPEWNALVQVDFISVAIGALCLLVALGVLAILDGHTRRRTARYHQPPVPRRITVAGSLEAARRTTARPAVVAVEGAVDPEEVSALQSQPETPEPTHLVRQWLAESQRMLEATRRERAAMAEAFDGVATRLLQLEQAVGAVAQGLRAKR